MTPGINVARKAKVVHSVHAYAHDPASASYGLEAAEKLGVPQARVFKTLVVCLDGRELAVGVVPVSAMLGMKQIARAAGARKAAMAAPHEVERATGYVLGGSARWGRRSASGPSSMPRPRRLPPSTSAPGAADWKSN